MLLHYIIPHLDRATCILKSPFVSHAYLIFFGFLMKKIDNDTSEETHKPHQRFFPRVLIFLTQKVFLNMYIFRIKIQYPNFFSLKKL